MIVEVRSNGIKPGHRAKFIDLFQTRAIPATLKKGLLQQSRHAVLPIQN
jgi:hypothetical protein